MLLLMFYLHLLEELNLLDLLYLIVLRKAKYIGLLDNNGIIKEIKVKDLKKLNKLKKRNDVFYVI